ncbi:MAG: hypothetical protein J0L56_18910 [Chitinophagales bacterium]|nr:hypothetical protein [Chitinophagales bacterium]
MEKITEATYYPEQKIVELRLRGLLNAADIENWKNEIEKTMSQVPDNSTFKMLVNLHGFKAENFEVHKAFRNIVPLLLADYGYRIGYLDMFPEASVELKNTRGIQCVAMANVHQDETKMKDYQENFSSAKEQYFTEPLVAEQWIESI